MDRKFPVGAYVINCTFTLFFTCIIAATYFDVSNCPYTSKNTETEKSLLSILFHSSYSKTLESYFFSSNHSQDTNSHNASDSFFETNNHNNNYNNNNFSTRFSCHMIDIVVWTYIIGYLCFMLHKYITYRFGRMHYFLLDYCYFHNNCLILFLLLHLVQVQYKEEPWVEWSSRVPEKWRSSIFRPMQTANATDSFNNVTQERVSPSFTYNHKEMWIGLTRLLKLPNGIYPIKSVDVVTLHHVMRYVSRDDVVSSFTIFFTLFIGSVGPILGAIIMWKNALLFHSTDRMTSCYLHLFPAIVQVLLLHVLFTTAHAELRTVDPAALVTQAVRRLADPRQGSSAVNATQTSHLELLVPGLYALVRQEVLPFVQKMKTIQQNKNAKGILKRLPQKLKGTSKIFFDTLFPVDENGNLESLLQTFNYTQYENFHFRDLNNEEQKKIIKLYARYAKRYAIDALCGVGTLCYELKKNITCLNFFYLHSIMFAVWLAVYHIVNEGLRYYRQTKAVRRVKGKTIRPAARRSNKSMNNHSIRVSPEEAKEIEKAIKQESKRVAPITNNNNENENSNAKEVEQKLLALFNGVDPLYRETSYTWMMKKPPGGVHGLPYRFVTFFGAENRLMTTILFNLSQYITHFIFVLAAYGIAVYPSMHVYFSVLPLLVLILFFVSLCVYHAALMNAHWIRKLQKGKGD